MNRYVLYNVLLISIMNIMLFVPFILIKERFSGAVSSILIAPFIGTALIYMYTSAMQRFPGKGLPEILKEFCPKWIVAGLMMFYAVMWWFSAAIVIVAYAILINRFFNPDANITTILVMLLVVCAYAASRSTLTVMFSIEISLVLNAPLVLFMLFKMFSSRRLNFDAMHIVANYAKVMPTIASLAAATFIFTGYINLSLYNRLFPPQFVFKLRWVYPVIGFMILLSSFFVPIGFHGTAAVDRYIYIWPITADSLMMHYGFIERVLFLFLIIFLNMSLTYTMSGWHQAMEFVKSSIMPQKKPVVDSRETPLSNYIIIVVFALATLLYDHWINEKLNLIITQYWLILRMFTEILTVLAIFIYSRRRSHP
ncbi:GerAB/ArcD/ProY family transporter [Paenibacillus sp. HB172176]|uniref:GerAB/ArcD/ProY family transporter n=1 Tax=Paenibacillus sp. HB172176 TaxID=2493690 RepID=UPI0014391BDE|nr:GerAB/ArcD/ProY family transporter [Paenibacillus sp. HB172176]